MPDRIRDSDGSLPPPQKVRGLVEDIKGKPFYFGVTVHHADVELGAEFCVCMGFAPHNGPDPRLGQADDTIFHAVGTILVHVELLLIERGDGIQEISPLFRHLYIVFLDDICNKSDVAEDILKLLPYSGSDLFGAAFLPFGRV